VGSSGPASTPSKGARSSVGNGHWFDLRGNRSRACDSPRVSQRLEGTQRVAPIDAVMQRKPSEKRDHARLSPYLFNGITLAASIRGAVCCGIPSAFCASLNQLCATLSQWVCTSGTSDSWAKVRHTMPWRWYSPKVVFASVMVPSAVQTRLLSACLWRAKQQFRKARS
jgi:hypothetical protein